MTSLSTGNINTQSVADAIAEVPHQRLSNSSAYGSTETTGDSSGGASPNNTTTNGSSSTEQSSSVVLDVRGLTTRR